jgi:hypothetical protein
MNASTRFAIDPLEFAGKRALVTSSHRLIMSLIMPWRPTSLLSVERQQPEALPPARAQGAEVTLVQGEDVPRPMPLCEHDERRIGEADL